MTRRPVNCTAVSLKAKLEGSERYVLVGRDFYIEDGADKDFLSRLCGLPLYHLSGARAADYLPAIKRAIRLLEADPAAYASPPYLRGRGSRHRPRPSRPRRRYSRLPHGGF